MDRHLRVISSKLFLLIIIAIIGDGYGYKWIPLKSGDPLPTNAVSIENGFDTFVGRSKHFDDILPAEVDKFGHALVSTCGEEIPKDEFEILTSSNECEWQFESKNQCEKQDEIVLRVGTNYWNKEPIYLGLNVNQRHSHISSIYSDNNEKRVWKGEEDSYRPKWKVLCCNIGTKWIPSSPKELPNNTVYGGISNNYRHIYVARFKKDCEMIIGQAIPQSDIAEAYLKDGSKLDAHNFEVLIGEPNEYTWVSAEDGNIPENALVYRKDGFFNIEYFYVTRIDRVIRKLTHSELREKSDYDILVKNIL